MRGRKKLNLRDAAIFVLFLVLFFMAFPLLFMSISDVANGVSFWEAFSDNTLNGLLIDWIVIIAMFVGFLLAGKGKKNLYMTFGMNKRAFYEMTMKENCIRASCFAIIRTGYLFVLRDKYDRYNMMDGYGSIIGTAVCLLISGFMIYMILVMSKDILDSLHVSKMIKQIREEGLTRPRKYLKRSADTFIFIHVILSWLLCFVCITMQPLNFDLLDILLVRIGVRLDWMFLYSTYVALRERGHLFTLLLMLLCFVLTWRIYRKENLKKQDWIE